ncbi:thioredoxin-like protein [Spinellus fusiger]|nr:thioredoxin-like protein [Spinellus fusiger]
MPIGKNDLSDYEDEDALFAELERDDDNDLAMMRERRMREIQEEITRRQEMGENKHGVCTEITSEKEFMNITTSEKYVVGHFFHKDFRRCKIMDTHLEKLAEKHYGTRFIRIEVQNAPFLVEKLQIQVLPCVMAWVNGYAQTKLIGFDELGNSDAFQTSLLEMRLSNAGVLKQKQTDTTKQVNKSIFQSNEYDEDFSD